jgi:formate-dependent nitrite reductase membrane component NrfD
MPKRDFEGQAANRLGAAYINPADAYRDVPILKRPVWNHEIAAYFYLGGISAGSAAVGSLAELVNSERYKKLARTAHYVSFATFLPCPALLIDDLGVPSRFHHMLRVFKPSSPMNLGAWAFAIHGAGATITVARMLVADAGAWRATPLPLRAVAGLVRLMPERLLAGLGLPSSLILAGYTGVLLGTTSIPVWHRSPLLGALFTASAFSAGTAAVSLADSFRGGSAEGHAALGKLALASGTTELALIAGYIATSGQAAKPYSEGATRALMVGATGATVAATLLDVLGTRSKRRKRSWSTLASIATLLGGALLRWAVVRAGRASASDREGTLEAMKPRESVPGWGSS